MIGVNLPAKKKSKDKTNISIENTLKIILKSKSKSKIYVFLIRKNGAKTEEIIRETNLHPSTVRENLSRMFEKKIIKREKIKNGNIGKNPYIYHAIKPSKLLKKYLNKFENTLNQIANLEMQKKESQKLVRIIIKERLDKV